MPGLKQLQQFNSDIMTLGDEAKIRAARGEKPVTVKIPKTVQDIDDSDDFIGGLHVLSEEEQAQADAAEKERDREANDFSDFLDDKDPSEEQSSAPKKTEPVVPDMSDLLPSGDDMDLGDFDLSEFEDNTPEVEPEPEPKEVAIEDMDLDSLLAMSDQNEEPAAEEESDLFAMPEEQNAEETAAPANEMEDVSGDSLFGDEHAASEPDGKAFDSSLFDMPEENPVQEEELPELDENSLADTLGSIGEFNDVPSDDDFSLNDIPSLEEISTNQNADEIPKAEAFDFSAEPVEPSAESLAEFELPSEDTFNIDSFEAPSGNEISELESMPSVEDEAGAENTENAGQENVPEDISDISDVSDVSIDDFNLPSEDTFASKSEEPSSVSIEDPGDLELPPEDFASGSMGTPDLDSLPADDFGIPVENDSVELPEIPETSVSPGDVDVPASDPIMDEFSNDGLDGLADSSAGDSTAGNEEIALPDFGTDSFDDPNEDFATTDSVSLNDDLPTEFNEIPDLNNLPDEGKTSVSDDMGLPDFGDDGSTDDFASMDFSLPGDSGSAGGDDLGSDFGSDFGTDFSTDSFSPEEAVTDEDASPVELFDTSDINDLDFSGEENSDFELGSLDGAEGDDEFSIPGFSDTVTAVLDKHAPKVQTPDFSGAASASDEDKPKNTFTDNEYKRFLANLATYPLNVRIALEDFVVKNEFTDDAIFAVLEKVLRKAPARQVATELEKLLDISLDVPRDFERRSVAEYEAYKKSMEYQLKNKIIPGAILTAAASILIFCIFTLTNNFVYKPLRASSLYNQGYALLEDSQYPQSQEKFNQALTFRPVKKWFYTYAEGYRNHKQYDRSRMMYRAILSRYDHEKKAGLDWARMESDDLYNYEECERILKREVLDYHINDSEGILALGDLYLDWATESDGEKFPLAKHNYDLLVELYGTNNLYLSRQMRYFIRTDNLRQVLMYKDIFMDQKKGLQSEDEIELSGYMLDKRYGKLRPSEESLRSKIEDVRKLLERALKSDPENAVARYNMGRYFVETSSGKNAAKLLQASIDSFEEQTKRNRRDTYKYINAHRLLGEEMCNEREYLTAETLYGRGIEIFERENSSSRFESDENVGKLYADLADIDYFIAADNDAALMHYESAVNNKYDTASVRYRIGYIQYQNQNYPAALGSFIRSQDTSGNDVHLLLALANTLSLSSDNYVARGYYERLLSLLDVERQKAGVLLPQVREDQGDIVDLYMKATNNLGVTLTRIAANTGDSSLNAKAIVNLQESLRAWDALTRNPHTMIRLEGANLAEQNVRYITHPVFDYEPEIYTEIPRMLYGEEGLE